MQGDRGVIGQGDDGIGTVQGSGNQTHKKGFVQKGAGSCRHARRGRIDRYFRGQVIGSLWAQLVIAAKPDDCAVVFCHQQEMRTRKAADPLPSFVVVPRFDVERDSGMKNEMIVNAIDRDGVAYGSRPDNDGLSLEHRASG